MVERVIMKDNGTKSGRIEAAGRYLRGEISISDYKAIRTEAGLSSSEYGKQGTAQYKVGRVQESV